MPFAQHRHARLQRLFFEGFTAMDLAEPLVSFDVDADAEMVRGFLCEKGFDLVGIRRDGLVCGYALQEALTKGRCENHLIPFSPDGDLIAESAGLTEVVRCLDAHRHCFVTIFDQPAGIITLDDLEKPPMRMFLFGIITIFEMFMTQFLRDKYPDGSWETLLSEARLAKARELKEERERRGQMVDLMDCLQFGDKGGIFSHDAGIREAFGFKSRREIRDALSELEMLRNNLAHTQAIVPASWSRIVTLCSRMEVNMKRVSAISKGSSPPGPATTRT